MFNEKQILANRKKALQVRIPNGFRPTRQQVAKFKRSMRTFDDRAYLIYDAVNNTIHLSDDGEDTGQYLGLFVIGKFKGEF